MGEHWLEAKVRAVEGEDVLISADAARCLADRLRALEGIVAKLHPVETVAELWLSDLTADERAVLDRVLAADREEK